MLGEVVVVGLAVVLPGVHGVATVAEVPLGDDVDSVELPVPAVDGVEEDAVVVVPVLALFAGVQGAVVVVVPVVLVAVVPPDTLPALPAALGEGEVAEGDPMELGAGGDVCNVPTEPELVELVPGADVVVPVADEVVPCELEVTPVWVEVVPGCVDVVPWGEEVVVCVPMPGLGVTEPVLCAEARPTDSANTDEANRIFRIEPAPS